MAQRYGNIWARMARSMLSTFSTRTSTVRLVLVLGLTWAWLTAGLMEWLHLGWAEALSRTLALLQPGNRPEPPLGQAGRIAWYAGMLLPWVVALYFLYSDLIGRLLAQTFLAGSSRHVVIAGRTRAAMALACDCARFDDCVALVGAGIGAEESNNLRRQGIYVLDADPKAAESLRTLRAHHAAHVVALEESDTDNLQIAAEVHRLVGSARRRPPIILNVATSSALLLREARVMQSTRLRRSSRGPESRPIDHSPISLDELVARDFMQRHAQTLLAVANELRRDRPHILFIGFDPVAEVLAATIFRTLWSVHFADPRITVLTRDSLRTQRTFHVKYKNAFSHSVWMADIEFLEFDWDVEAIETSTLSFIEEQRGAPCAAVVATPSVIDNIQLAMAMLRGCSVGQRWPIPIYLYERSKAGVSAQYYAGPGEASELEAYLDSFSPEDAATRKRVINADLDRGAAVAHEHYSKGLSQHGQMSARELRAALRDFDDVLTSYRDANRAVADSAIVKVWDAGWRIARRGEKGDNAPTIPDELFQRLAEVEHKRWIAERLMSGWRPTNPGETRNNDLMAHDKLVPWEALTEQDRENDAVQVRAAIDIARIVHPNGFMPLA